MAKLIHRAAALLGCSLILAFVTACGSGSAAELTEGAASASAATTPAASAPSDSLLPEGTYRTPELTRKQLIATGVKAGFTRAQAEHALALDRINPDRDLYAHARARAMDPRDAIRIRFKNPHPQRMCQGDPKCPMGFIVWESAPFSRV
jgi:hypothetical protein